MARFGRGQPHAPIVLRNALITVITAANVHVVAAPRVPRPAVSHPVILHGARSLVPDRLAPQIHVVGPWWQQRIQRARGAFVFVHGARSLVPNRLPTPLHVILTRTAPRRGSVVLFRTAATAAPAAKAAPVVLILANSHPPTAGRAALLRPSRSSLVPDRLAPQIHVTPLLPRAARRASVLLSRTPAAPAVVASRPSEPLVVLARRLPQARRNVVLLRTAALPPKAPKAFIVLVHRVQRPRGDVMLLRGTSVVPARLPPQLQILLQRGRVRRGDVLLVRGGAAVVVIPIRISYWQEINAESLAADVAPASWQAAVISSTAITTTAIFTTDLDLA